MFIIKVTLKKIYFCSKPWKSEVVTLLWKTLENYFKILVYKQSKYMHFLILLSLVFFNVLHGSNMSFAFSNLHMNSLSNDKVSNIKHLCRYMLLSFITLINTKTWAYELNSNFKNKSEWTLCYFMNSDLNKQVQALDITFSRKTKSCHSQTCFNNILRTYLNEKLNFYQHIIEKNAQIHIRSENLFY